MIKNKKGFSLVEISLVLGIAVFISFIAFSQLLKKQEVNKASMAGNQIKLIGDSVNAYISNHYDTISTLTAAAGTVNDIGPRTCLSANNTCTINVSTLISEGLLPSTYSAKNVYGHGYNIILKRSGTSPYYKIYGMITTTSPLAISGDKLRYDLLGEAMKSAGIDSGMTRGSANTVAGFNGAWSASATDYSNINQAGLLAYQAGYGTYNYSVFLRRDGTLPMTGNLNLGTNSIDNAVNITASGATTSGTLKSTGATTVGSTLNVAGASTLTGVVNAANVVNVTGALNANSTLKVNGVSTLTGAVNAGNALTVAGAVNANNTLNVAGVSTLRGNVNTSAGLTVAGTSTMNGVVNANNALNVSGNTLLRSATTVNGVLTVNNSVNASGNITSSGQVRGATLVSSGRTTVGEFAQFNGVATLGASCSPNGLQGRDSTGSLLSCTSGKWGRPGGGLNEYSGTTCPAGEVLVASYGNVTVRSGRCNSTNRTMWVTPFQLSQTISESWGANGQTNCSAYTLNGIPSMVKCG